MTIVISIYLTCAISLDMVCVITELHEFTLTTSINNNNDNNE